MRRREFFSLLGGAAAACPLATSSLTMWPRAALAQDWPTRPIRFIVPLAAGGGLDFVARVVGEQMSRELRQQIFVENRTGAGSTIGIDTAIKSAPDGYTVLVTNDNVASAPHVMRLSVDFLQSLEPVCVLGRQPQGLAVHRSLTAVNSVADLIALAKEKPGMGCATSGVGSNQHVLLEWLARQAGVKFDHVPYRGAGQAINDLVAGHVQVGILGPTALIPHAKAGTLKMLAQSGPKRSKSLPDVPTLAESGFAEITVESWYAAFVPLGTPAPVIARLNAAANKALTEPGTLDQFLTSATEPVGGTPEELAKAARADFEKYARLIGELNIRTN